jgi:hypothetical protein
LVTPASSAWSARPHAAMMTTRNERRS